MSDKPGTMKVLAELEESAATAALLSHVLQNLALLMERVGAPDVALQTKTLDIPGLLALPPEQATALLTRLYNAVSFLGAACYPANRDDPQEN